MHNSNTLEWLRRMAQLSFSCMLKSACAMVQVIVTLIDNWKLLDGVRLVAHLPPPAFALSPL